LPAGILTSAAKAAVDFAAFTARLEATPFQNVVTHVFSRRERRVFSKHERRAVSID